MQKTSIVVVNWNTCDLTMKCVELVQQYTNIPYEIILVDNGSVDGSVDAIKKLENEFIKAVYLPENLGYAVGNNRGIEVASGDYICLLNSDAFVTPGWLQSMISTISKNARVGLVGPWTNKCKGKQRHKPKYKLIPRFLRKSRKVEYLSFFCVLIDRKVINTIGLLDERFGLGTFEDDDFCRRASNAGFELRIDGKSWVWHEAHATMTANKMDEIALKNKNRDIFDQKWT